MGRLPLEQAEGVLRQRQGVAAGGPGLVDELLQLRERLVDPGQHLGRLQPEVDRPVPGLGRGHAPRHSSAAGRLPGRVGTRASRPDGQIVDPQGLLVGQEAGAEVGRQQELIELHVREVGRAEDHVGAIDDEPAVEPGAHDAVRMGAIPLAVEGVQAEHRLDAMPRIVGEELVLAVVEGAVVSPAERALGQPVRCVPILDVLGRQAEPTLLRLDVHRQAARGRAVIPLILGRQELDQVGVIGPATPAPAPGQPEEEAHVDGLGRLEQPSQGGRAFRRRRALLPAIGDATVTRPGAVPGDDERPSVVPAAPGSRTSSKPSRKSTPSASSVDRADEVPTVVVIRAAAVAAHIAIADPSPRGRVLVCMIRPSPGQPAPLDTAPTVGGATSTGQSLAGRAIANLHDHSVGDKGPWSGSGVLRRCGAARRPFRHVASALSGPFQGEPVRLDRPPDLLR